MTPFTPPTLGLEWEEYNADLYVARPIIEGVILEWLNDPQPQHSVRSLVGPPGTGKSWLLAHFRDKTNPSCGKLYLTARDLINGDHRDRIKQNLIRAANECCPELMYPETSLPTLEAIIEGLSERMIRKCRLNFVLLMVDGCDDLDEPEEFDRVQVVLTKFFAEHTVGFRMLIARRSQLTHYKLRKHDQPIEVEVFRALDGPDSPEEQKRKLLQLKGIDPDTIELRSILPKGHHYQWNHPFINCFLLSRHSQGAPLTLDALRLCCLALVNRPIAPLGDPERHPVLDDEMLDTLIELSIRLPEQWDGERYKMVAQRELEARDLRRGTIVNIRDEHGNSTPFYTIADGLRELLRDIAKMQQTEVEQ